MSEKTHYYDRISWLIAKVCVEISEVGFWYLKLIIIVTAHYQSWFLQQVESNVSTVFLWKV